MALYFSSQRLDQWLAFFDQVLKGNESSGVPLREDLLKKVNDYKTSFAANVSSFYELRSQKQETKQQVQVLQRQAEKILLKVRHALKSQLSEEELTAVWGAYNFGAKIPRAREKVLAALQTALVTAEKETAADRKPDATLLASLKSTTEAFQTTQAKMNSLSASMLDLRRTLNAALKDNRQLQKQITSYLITVLPNDTTDARLIEYGLRKKFASDRPTSVRVVSIEEAGPVAEPVAVVVPGEEPA